MRKQNAGSGLSDLENLELKATVEGQELFIRQLREELRANGDVQGSTSSVEMFENRKKVLELENKLRDNEIELSRFREELNASQQSMDATQRQYTEMKTTAETKDFLVGKLRREIDNMAEKLDQYQKEKAAAAEKLNAVQSDLSSLAVENDWLKSQLKLAEKSLKDIGKESGGSRTATKKRGSHAKKESLEELMQLTSEYESLLKATEYEGGSSSFATNGKGDVMETHSSNLKDEKFIRDMNKRMENIEKRVKEAVITEKYHINAEKENLIQEFKNLHKTLSQHQRMHESYMKDVEAKDSLIKRLKSIKESLESEVEGLRQELLKVREECDRHVKEKHVDNMKLISAKSKVSATCRFRFTPFLLEYNEFLDMPAKTLVKWLKTSSSHKQRPYGFDKRRLKPLKKNCIPLRLLAPFSLHLIG